MRRQVSVSTVKQNRVILDYAKTVYQNIVHDAELINLIMADWYNHRQENSKSGALRRIEKELVETKEMIRKLMEASDLRDDGND